MRCLHFSYKQIIECFKSGCVAVPHRYVYLNHSLKVLVGLGGFSIIPSVYAHSDLKSESSDKENKQQESLITPGWERVKTLYQRDEYGSLSKELMATLQTTFFASFCGALYGGVNSSRIAYRDFIERNQATMFDHHLDAKRRLQNHVTIHFGKGALKWGVKLGVFNAGFMLFLTTMLAYRGDAYIRDYMISGSVVGGFLRLRIGPKGALVGATLGCLLGGLCGSMTRGMFYMTGSSLDDVLSFQYELEQRRLSLFKDIQTKDNEKHIDEQTLRLLNAHDASEDVKKNITPY